MSKKSPSRSSGSSTSEYNINIPCFPSPVFTSHSHLRHVLPQIPTRAGHPRTAVSKHSTRDPFLGRMSEGEMFADVITTHRLDDNLDQMSVMTKDLHGDSKFYDRTKPENHKSASSGGGKHVSSEPYGNNSLEVTSQSDVKGRKASVWEEDTDYASVTLARSVSPSIMLNIDDNTKKRTTVHKARGTSEFVKLGQKASKDFSTAVDDLDSGHVTNNSRSSKQSKLSNVVDSVLHPVQSRYATKLRTPDKSSLFRLSDDDDTDDDNSSGDSPVAMNLSLATKSPLRLSSNAESLPKFPASQDQPVSRGTGPIVGSPLDAIMKMTHMINTSKNEPPSFMTNADATIAAGSFPQHFSTAYAPFQSRGDVWPRDARIFGSDSLPGMSYGKIAAEGMLKLPVAAPVSDAFDSTADRSVGEFSDSPTDRLRDSPAQFPSEKQTSRENTGEDSERIRISDGNPIKLKIRRGARGDNSLLSVVTSKPSRDATGDDVMVRSSVSSATCQPSSLALSLLGADPSAVSVTAPTGTTKSRLPAPGRAKTKGELKKQLFERKEQRLRTDDSQASSPAGSTMTPSPSNALSPLSVNVDGGSSTPQPTPPLSSSKTSATAVTSPTENVSMTFLCSIEFMHLRRSFL